MTDRWWREPPSDPDGYLMLLPVKDRTDLWAEIAAQIHHDFADQQFSIVDRTSWSIMQRLGVHEAISFDWDYSIYRFGRNRRQAFTVHA